MILKTMNRACDKSSGHQKRCQLQLLQLWESPAVPGAVASAATGSGEADMPGKHQGVQAVRPHCKSLTVYPSLENGFLFVPTYQSTNLAEY